MNWCMLFLFLAAGTGYVTVRFYTSMEEDTCGDLQVK
jgi:hypothetical protein